MTEARLQSRPLVVLLGFLGCRSHTLAKYAAVHTEQYDCDVILFQPSALSILFSKIAMKRTAELAKEINDNIPTSQGRPVIFHVLSNNGAYQLGAILNMTHQESLRPEYQNILKNTQGIIFDSCPCDPSVELLVKGFTSFIYSLMPTVSSIFGTHERNYTPPKDEHPVLSPVLKSAFGYLLNTEERVNLLQQITFGLHYVIPPCVRQLYLCSDSDTLITLPSIRDFADKQFVRHRSWDALNPNLLESQFPKELSNLDLTGVSTVLSDRIVLHNFVTSAHVHHLRMHKTTYNQLVKSFVDSILNSYVSCQEKQKAKHK
jgi:hypothetical protein